MSLIVNDNRKAWIDGLRALAIILVVFGHQMKGVTEYFIFTSPVKMPLFFAISGYLFKMRDGDTNSFFIHLFKKLIIPWFCLALIPFLPKLFMGESFLEFISNLVSGKSLWFMPCFVIAEIIHFYVRKITKKDIPIAMVCILLTISGIVLHNKGLLDYAMFNRALSVQFFFLIGYWFKNNEQKMVNLPWGYIGLGGGLYLFLVILSLYIYPGVAIDVHLCSYYNYPYCFILIIIGLIVLFTAAAKSNYSNRILNVIGQNTLVLYIWHGSVIAILNYICTLSKISLGSIWISALLKSIWGVFVCTVLAQYINKFAPEIVGKRRLNRK